MADERKASPLAAVYTLLSAIRYRYRLIIFVAVVVLAAGLTYVMSMPDVYQSSTQILVNPQRVSDKYVNSIATMDASERLNTLSQQILSSSRLETIMDELHLFSNLRDKVSRDELIARMRKNIGIELKHNSEGLSAFTLSYTGDSAQEVATVANRLAASFISWNLHDREQEAKATTTFLANELTTTKSQLDDLEEQLRSYKMKHLGELPDQLDANMQTLSRLQVELQANTEAQSRLDHEALLTSSLPDTSSQRTAAPVTSSSMRQKLTADRYAAQTDLAELHKHYTDSFPDVGRKEAEIRALDAQIAALPADSTPAASATADSATSTNPRLQLIHRDRNRLQDEQRKIQSSIGRYQSRIDSAPVHEQEISQLLRDYGTARDHYRSLLEKTYSAQMAAQLEQEQQSGNFTMLDQARVPDAPIGPKRVPLFLGAFFFAIAAGIGVALLAETLDNTVKSENELRDCLPEIPLLGTTPGMKNVPMIRRGLPQSRFLLGGQ
ncbi:GumC family protein [Terriglobus roseus]|uniref:Polysaccharide chain length determinant protein, PEP-CTERM locus subfamily n=1 Tax=Terriglobus roseus TaxID=392734 RepID=A0A1G7JZ21_9BACT|nr:Wzz/FepE/Etk N-terminal domain-containing protein [Terriglobus roseus]SDF30206.1 polysaccharide chain length determinant protein, PEP-CTERM locus subfamily [Terriglobus roseus]